MKLECTTSLNGDQNPEERTSEMSNVIEAPHGQKMITLSIRLWTNNIAPKGKQLAKHAWAAGQVTVDRNDAHGIEGTRKGVGMFHTLLGLNSAIEEALKDQGIVLHANEKMTAYFSSEPVTGEPDEAA